MRNGRIAFFCCCVLPAAAQRAVTGRAVAGDPDQPIAGISVFVNKSSAGTITASDGSFRLKEVPAGDMIVSGVSFETTAYAVTPGSTPLNLRMDMLPLDYAP